MRTAARVSAVTLCWAAIGAAAQVDAPFGPALVSDTSGLIAALERAAPGTRVRVAAGRYLVDRPLRIPDGVALEGAGEMTVGDAGEPAGFEPGSATILRATPTIAGNVLTLNDGASVRGLRIENPRGNDGGNAIAILSRRAGDDLSAAVVECEIANGSVMGANAAGPTGRSIVVLTLHRVTEDDPPHEDARVSLTIERSIVTSTHWTNALFAINFAARGRIVVTLRNNVLEGGAAAAGGVSRNDEVSGAVTTVTSMGNRYLNASPQDRAGWTLIGGSGFPHASSAVPGTDGNRLQFSSVDDRIEGFPVAVMAIGGRRLNALSGPISGNVVQLVTERLTILTPDAATDLSLHGALYVSQPGSAPGPSVGDDNIVRVTMRSTQGSGRRNNLYSDQSGLAPSARPAGNRLELTGTASDFARSNRGIEPQPPAKYFVGGDPIESDANANSERFRAFQDP